MQIRLVIPAGVKAGAWSDAITLPNADGSAISYATSVIPSPQPFDWRTACSATLQSHLQPDDTHFVLWNGTHAELLQKIAGRLQASAGIPRLLLALSADPLPPQLAAVLGGGLAAIARLPTPDDVICLHRKVLDDSPPDTTLLSLLVREMTRPSAGDSVGSGDRSAGVSRSAAGAQLQNALQHTAENAPRTAEENGLGPCVLSEANARVAVDRLPAAGPGVPDVSATILKSACLEALPGDMLPPEQRTCLLAGLLLIWDLLEDSHELSQSLEGHGVPRTADYWHGIMHRREPDAGNARYWFRRVGRHPAFETLAADLLQWLQWHQADAAEVQLVGSRLLRRGVWDPLAMIDLTQEALQHPGGVADCAVRRVQYFEMLNLLRHDLSQG